MNCHEIRDLLLTDYIDDEMEAPDRQALDAHLAQCPECTAFLDQVRRQAVDPIRRGNGSVMEVPDLVRKRIQKDIEHRAHQKAKRNIFSSRPALAAMAASLACVLVLSTMTLRFYRPGHAPDTAAPVTTAGQTWALLAGEYFSADDNDGETSAVEEYFSDSGELY